MPENFIHIFTVGDHYSAATGSSYPTVIYELTRCHEAAGGKTFVIVGKGTMEGYPPYPVGEVVEVNYGPFEHRRYVRLLDALQGAAGLRRSLKWKAYRAALDAIPVDFDGYVFVHGEPAVVVPLKKARPNAKIVLYCHYDLFRWYAALEVNRIAGACHRLLCVSGYIARYVNGKAGRELENARVVLNGVDAGKFTPASQPPAGPPVILFVGRVTPEKGVDLLVRAALALKERGLQFRLRIVGGQYLGVGAPVSDFQREVAVIAAGLGEVAEFKPFVPREQITGVYQAADIFCAPSTWDEPFGMTVTEAMACGLPTVVSRRGAFPEVAGDAALYFDPPDVAALAGHLERLLHDPAERARLGATARRRAEESTWEKRYALLVKALTE